MTYIVGLKQPGVNAIISDLRITWISDGKYSHGEDIALKTGLLFPGCIFGRTGSTKYSSEFIVALKQHLDGQTDSFEGFWRKFRAFVDNYSFSPHKPDQFELLLLKRSSRRSKFYLLDSSKGILELDNDQKYSFFSFGSGKAALDDYLYGEVAAKLDRIRRFLSQGKNLPENASANFAQLISPYFLCLWLSEWSLTLEKSFLERHRVGGVFHFAYQTWKGESPQQPAIYFFSSADRTSRIIVPWIYRVAYVSSALYIESITPPGQDRNAPEGRTEQKILMDEASGIDNEFLDPKSSWAKVQQELNKQPFYFFCGFGFINRRERSSVGYRVSTVGEESHIFDENGRLTLAVQREIARGFDLNDFMAKRR